MIPYAPLTENPRVKPAERAHIMSEPSPEPGKIGWLTLVPHRQTWAFAIGKFMTDPFWWLYLFWVPDFLNRTHGLNLLQIGPPLVTIYLLSDVGSIAGGWFSSMLMRRGWTANAARKTAMLVCALGVAPVFLATRTDSLWVAVFLLGLATAAHQGFSANLFTLTTDMFPSQAVGSAVGFGGMAGAIGGMLIAQIAGRVLPPRPTSRARRRRRTRPRRRRRASPWRASSRTWASSSPTPRPCSEHPATAAIAADSLVPRRPGLRMIR